MYDVFATKLLPIARMSLESFQPYHKFSAAETEKKFSKINQFSCYEVILGYY